MNHEHLFTVSQFVINFEKLGEPIYLIPFGDVHRSSSNCSVTRWKEFLKWAQKKERCYFLGMGDYDDLASGSERDILGNNKIHDSTKLTIENLYNHNTDRFLDEISFMKGKLIGMIEGNHFGLFESGMTTTQKMCESLGCKYLGGSSVIRLKLKKGHFIADVDIFAHHGKGAAQTIGGDMNAVDKMSNVVRADIYAMGHSHGKGAIPKPILQLNQSDLKPQLIHKKQWFVRTGSFLKGYEDGTESYIAKGVMRPADLGVVKIELTPTTPYIDGRRVEVVNIHVSL